MTDEEKRAHHCEKELAQFIRSGASRRPDQAFGAAYEGMYRLPAQASGLRPTKDLEWFFDCLEGSVRKCPGGDDCKKTLSLAAIMVHLNDHHKWSREEIAGWLEGLK